MVPKSVESVLGTENDDVHISRAACYHPFSPLVWDEAYRNLSSAKTCGESIMKNTS